MFADDSVIYNESRQKSVCSGGSMLWSEEE